MAIRMVFVLLITFYTTRVILNNLGVEDYGVYNVVCGFVSMFTFLNTSMSNGIQRFFNYELGQNGEDGANKVFNSSLLIQGILAFLIIVLTESFGLWYLHNKMVIPTERMFAAEWIFQFSILSFLFIIMQAPYTASVMAHERMDFYAIISVFDAILKLGIVLLLPMLPGDDLIVYGILFTLISIINFVVYCLYCKRNFPEIRIGGLFNKALFKSMLGFSGWNIFGSFAHMMKEQGINLVLNLFFGPVVNAARGVAAQVNAGLQSFVQNITIPVRPQVVQSYAKGEINRTMQLTYSVSKLSVLFLYMLSLPILFEIDFILKIWLGNNVPDHTNTFIIIIVITSFLNNLNAAISNVVHATGIMQRYQVWSAVVVLSSIPFAYIILFLGGSPESAMWITFVTMITAQITALLILKTLVAYSIKDYLKDVILPFILVVLSTIWIPYVIHEFFTESFIRFCIVTIFTVVSVGISLYYVGLNSSERKLINTILSGFIVKFKK